ncbi:MAG: ribose 5-phosphate isomerase B [Dehalococcoidales bacterium]|nr:ribose 5-phosphate isomerase B [Dehalococcoidales bacterium]
MRIALGSDHRGLELKQKMIKQLEASSYSYHDFGCYTAESVDYPDYARLVAEAVAKGDFERGILICGTGIGMSIAANKVAGIRAAACCDVFTARRAREHNDAQILCLGAEHKSPFAEMVKIFLTTQYEGGRHQQRLDKIAGMERGC